MKAMPFFLSAMAGFNFNTFLTNGSLAAGIWAIALTVYILFIRDRLP